MGPFEKKKACCFNLHKTFPKGDERITYNFYVTKKNKESILSNSHLSTKETHALSPGQELFYVQNLNIDSLFLGKKTKPKKVDFCEWTVLRLCIEYFTQY